LISLGGPGWLALAILCEVFATSFLKLADGFTRPLPSLAVAVGYGLAFYCLSVALRTIPVGIAYAIWCGAGIVLITAVAWVVYDQRLDAWALAAIGLILLGTLMLNLRSPFGG
jgi:small multidrug resistance pump